MSIRRAKNGANVLDMTERGIVDVQAELLAHAERQTKALESINTYLMRTLAVVVLVVLIALIAWLSS